MKEAFYRLAGYRKPGVIEVGQVGGVRDVVFGEVPRREERWDRFIDLSANYIKTQGRVSSCACATMCGMMEDILISKEKNKLIEIMWQPMWDEMKAMGIASDETGSALLDNIWYAKERGVYDNRAIRWKIDIVEKIPRADCEKFIRMGYQVFTGAMCGRPLCDKNWVFRLFQRVFGHGFRLCGLDFNQSFGNMLLAETTWKYFGLRKMSQFFYPVNATKKLMSCYVFTIKRAG